MVMSTTCRDIKRKIGIRRRRKKINFGWVGSRELAYSSAPATTPAPAPSGGGGGAMASLLSKTIGKTWTCKGCTSPVNEDLNVCTLCNASRP
eukprot:Awhi_evm1s5956